MLLAYLDEFFTKELYYICAVVVPDDVARTLADALDGVPGGHNCNDMTCVPSLSRPRCRHP